jgi:dTDP-4-amino-4,6-dideoxygalactose transaminase
MDRIRAVKPHLPRLEDIANEVREILDTGYISNFGRFSRLLEERARDYLGVAHALCVSNATAGLMLILNDLPKGSEVIVSSFTFPATVHAILWNSLLPVFVDVDPSTYMISPAAVRSYLAGQSAKVSAILATHVFGACCAVEELEELAREYQVRLFFDAAHAFGTMHRGKRVGGSGEAQVFSLSATKLLACGEGGLVATNSESMRQLILNRRNYGYAVGKEPYDCENLGLNAKMAEFGAILGVWGIEHIEEQIQKRIRIAEEYVRGLGHLPGLQFQKIAPGDVSTYKDFTIVVDPQQFGVDRDTLRRQLARRGIETVCYFYPPIHRQTYFRARFPPREELVNTDRISDRIVSLPVHHELTSAELVHVIGSIQGIFEMANRG